MNEINHNELLLTVRGLERRIKRHLLKENCTFFAMTTPGFEHFLGSEIAKLPDTHVEQQITGGVIFTGPLDLIYYTNLHLRTANRILLRVSSFTARSYPETFNKARKLPWELYTGFNKEVSFSVSSSKSRLHHTENICSAVFDALHESMEQLGVSVERTNDAPVRFHIRFSDDICTISIDSSGDLLYKRGYRTDVAHAPIRESTACALLMAANWDGYPVIADPMCGSGVFLFEALLMSANRAPGIHRTFAFEQWPAFSIAKWERYKKNATIQELTIQNKRFVAFDIDAKAVQCTLKNYNNLNIPFPIEIGKNDCLEFNQNGEFGHNGLVISNLPYGKRVGGSDDLRSLYQRIGTHYRTFCKGWNFGFVSADNNFPKIAGLHVRNEIRFVNGGIPVCFFMGKF